MPETLGHVDIDGRPYAIELLPDRLEIRVGEYVALIEGERKGTTLSLVHTEVPPALRGKGLGEALTRAALDHARAQALTVKPYCPFVAKYLQRHPEYSDLVDPGWHRP